MDEYNDKVLRCIDCEEEFIFTAGEQLFFADKGLKNDPKRCKPCKSKKNDRMPSTCTPLVNRSLASALR